jgi:uncharacterized protein (TIGR02145 family)
MNKGGAYVWLISGAVMIMFAVQGTSCRKEPAEEGSGLYGSWIDTVDGTVYKTLRLGDQLWLAGNINRGVMVDGSIDQRDNGIIEKYCYDNNPVLCEKYGGLYQWNEAMQYNTSESSQGICPKGWHIPSDSEWKILEIYLGMTLETANDSLWRGIDQGMVIQTGGETGFEALRGGNRSFRGISFSQIGSTGYYWTSSMAGDSHAWRRGISLNEDGIYRSGNLRTFGFSVRCVKY